MENVTFEVFDIQVPAGCDCEDEEACKRRKKDGRCLPKRPVTTKGRFVSEYEFRSVVARYKKRIEELEKALAIATSLASAKE